MTTFFHVSRFDIAGITSIDKKVIDAEYWYVEDPGKFNKEDYLSFLSNHFPDGVSRHGEQYMLSRWPNATNQEGDEFVRNINVLEAIFEIVRIYQFPKIISRFQSFFGCRTLEDARQIRNTTFNGIGKIYKVECENYFEADMNLLFTGHHFSVLIYAEKYWSGEKSDKPFIEVLMEPPLKIISLIE